MDGGLVGIVHGVPEPEIPGYGLGLYCVVASWGHAAMLTSWQPMFKGHSPENSQVGNILRIRWWGTVGRGLGQWSPKWVPARTMLMG